MHRFYLAPTQAAPQPTLTLTGDEARHALHVLRLRAGEQATILDGAGQEFLCKIEATERDRLTLQVLERRAHGTPAGRLTLCVAVPKGKLIESIIQKATELGAARVVPLLTERVVAVLEREAAQEKQRKWQAVAVEAIKQSGAPWLPKVEAPLPLPEYLERREKFELALVGSLQPGSRHPREYLLAFEHEHQRKPGSVAVFVGPEGDFTPAELGSIEATGAKPITLGSLVLRVETAAIYCLSVLNYELQWKP